ncbi:MAG TPA: fumarate hydratase, partial [Candidatus Omnitrophica bacterium]|nr:fumarate hydratase [Candidatus Omnitrophota bacterium]
KIKNTNQKIYKLEIELLKEINNLRIGPMGLGGKTTCLGVNILSYPTHIAGLPVAINISCHALRSAVKIL